MDVLRVSTFASIHDNDPQPGELSWPVDFNEWREAATKADKEKQPLWSPVTYRPGTQRRRGQTAQNIEAVHALVLDYDAKQAVPVAAAREVWGGWEHVLHTTYSHTTAAPAYRMVLPLARSVSVREYGRLWAWAFGFATERQAVPDRLPDVGRCFFVPTRRPGGESFYVHNPSPDVLDPDCVFAVLGYSDNGVLRDARSGTSGDPSSVSIFKGIDEVGQLEDLSLIESKCAFMASCRVDAVTLPEPEWYAWLSVVARCQDGTELAHIIGSAYPGYSREETDDKLRRATEVGPRTCEAVRQISTACKGCSIGQPVGTTTSPVQLGRPDPTEVEAEVALDDARQRAQDRLRRARDTVRATEQQAASCAVLEAQTKAQVVHSRKWGANVEQAQTAAAEHLAAREATRAAKEKHKSAQKECKAAERYLAQVELTSEADPGVLALLTSDRRTGEYKGTKLNLDVILRQDPKYADRYTYDEFAERLFVSGRPAEDHLDTATAIDVERRYGIAVSTDLIREVAWGIAHERSFHPVREYLSGLTWDGEDRLRFLLRDGFVGIGDPEFLEQMGTRFCIGAVARILKPGCQMDNTLVLVGKQGIGKSTGLCALAGRKEWFADTTMTVGEKDSMMQIAGHWFYEIAEFDSFKRAENSRVRAFLTSLKDTFRPPFGRHPIERDRQTVFVGSTNEEQFLNDPTGSRRFLPVTLQTVNKAWINAQRDQLWAEAVVRYRAGEIWYFADDDAVKLEKHSEPYQQEDAWEQIVHSWLVTRKGKTVTVADALVASVGMDMSRISKNERNRMATLLKQLGCQEVRGLVAGRKTRQYFVPEDIAGVLPFPGAVASSLIAPQVTPDA